MTGDWTHRRGDAAVHGTAGTSAARMTSGPSPPLRTAAQPAAWRLRPPSAQRTMLSALVLLVLALMTGSDTSVHAAPDPTVEAIQRALVEREFDPGEVDGAMGWRTRGALRVFQRSVGLPDSGRTDDATLKALGLRPPGDAPAQADSDAPPRVEPSPMPSTEARKDEPPDAGTLDTEAPRAEPAPAAHADAAMAETPSAEPATDRTGTYPRPRRLALRCKRRRRTHRRSARRAPSPPPHRTRTRPRPKRPGADGAGAGREGIGARVCARKSRHRAERGRIQDRVSRAEPGAQAHDQAEVELCDPRLAPSPDGEDA